MTQKGATVPPPDPSQPWTAAVAVTAAILATLAAVSAMLSERNTTEAMIDQIQASDQWNYYQAKGVKLAIAENKNELLPALGKTATPEDQAKVGRYQTEQQEIKSQAEKKQTSANNHRRRAGIISNAATCSQIAIALTAICLLTKRRWFWYASILLGLMAVVFLSRGLWPLTTLL